MFIPQPHYLSYLDLLVDGAPLDHIVVLRCCWTWTLSNLRITSRCVFWMLCGLCCVICTSFVNAFVIGSTRAGVIWQEKGDPSKALQDLVRPGKPCCPVENPDAYQILQGLAMPGLARYSDPVQSGQDDTFLVGPGSTLPERVFPAKVSRDLVDLVSLLSPFKITLGTTFWMFPRSRDPVSLHA